MQNFPSGQDRTGGKEIEHDCRTVWTGRDRRARDRTGLQDFLSPVSSVQTLKEGTTLHYTSLLCTTLHCTSLHCNTLHYTALHCTVCNGILATREWKEFLVHMSTDQSCRVHLIAVQFSALQCSAIITTVSSTVQLAVQYSAVQCAVQCTAMQCAVECAVQCSDVY